MPKKIDYEYRVVGEQVIMDKLDWERVAQILSQRSAIEMRVYCSECGEVLEVSALQVMLGTDFIFMVKPCKKCVEQGRWFYTPTVVDGIKCTCIKNGFGFIMVRNHDCPEHSLRR